MTIGAIPTRALVLLGVLTLVWGFNWIIVAVALRDFGPWSFRAISLTIAVCTMFVISRLRGESLHVPKDVRWRLLFADRHPDCVRSGTFFPEP